MITIYTDGSCYRNPGPGGLGIVVDHNGSIEEMRGIAVPEEITNSQAELRAVIAALKLVQAKEWQAREMVLYCDSTYVVGIANRQYHPKTNYALCLELWKVLGELPNVQVRHLDGKRNPADAVSRTAARDAAVKMGMVAPANPIGFKPPTDN